MPLQGPTVELRALAKKMQALGTPGSPLERRFLGRVREGFKPVVKDMYRTGTGPDGSAWAPTKKGKQALASRKMPGMVAVKRIPGGLLLAWRRAWMVAHDEGHTFPARQVKAESAFLTFDKRGRLIKASRALYKRGVKAGQARAGVYQTFARAHTIGRRVLPPRHQLPRGPLPAPWLAGILRGAEAGFREIFG